jgi:cytochrome c oxidase subunit II
VPGAFPPLAGSAIAKGPVGAHIDIVLNGKPNTAMLPFSGQLDDLHIAAVVTYERNAFGNAVGDRVQPADVKAARGR